MAVKLQEHHRHHQIDLHEARLRDGKQVRRLNLAMMLAGGAFLVTTATSVTLIDGTRKNVQLLSELGSDITDIKLLVDQHVSGIMHEPAEAVASAMVDETLHLEDAPRSGIPFSAKTVRITAVSMRRRGTRAMPKTAPVTVTPREGDDSPKTVASARQYGALAYLDEVVGQFPASRITENSYATGQYPRSLGVREKKASAEFTHGQDDKSTFVKSSYNVGKSFSVGASFTQKNRNDEFQPLTDQKKGFWHMKMNSSLLGSSLDAEMALSSFDTETSKNFWTPERRMLKLGSQTTWQGFNVGVRYQSVGKDFESTADVLKSGQKKKKDTFEKDTQGPELWSYRQFGNLGVKTYTSLYSNNLAGDRTLPRFTTQKVGSSVNYLFSSWPEVGVTLNYATGTLGSSEEPAGFDSVSQDIMDIGSSIYYTGNLWSGSLSVENATGKANAANVTDMQLFYAEASFSPIDTVSISPSISYIREKYPEFNVGSDTLSSSLTFGYKPKPNGMNYSLYSEYSTEENTDWDVDNSYLYTSLGVSWKSKKPKSLIKQWSAELFYDQYIDNIYSDSNTGGLGFMLKLRSSPMSARRFVNDVR